MTLPMIHLTGNLVADPELRFTPSGKAVAKFRVASSHRVKDADGQWRDGATCFLDCQVWEGKAEALVEVARKGTTVMLSGRLGQREYETKEGERRTVYEIQVDDVAITVRAGKSAGAKSSRDQDPWAAAPAPNDDSEPPF